MAYTVLGWLRMNVSLYQAATALDGNTLWQQTIAENLAAGSTPAFKKLEISFGTLQAGVMGSGFDSILAQNIPSLLPKPEINTNFTQGSLQGTGVKSNLALDGPGFFRIQDAVTGEQVYGRDGEFRVSPQGEMVDKNNNPILGTNDQPINVDPRRKELIEVDRDGRVTQAGEVRGQIGVYEFADRNVLQPAGAGYFRAPPGAQPPEAVETFVMQGFLEAANTVSMIEMSTLLQALRHYEANQRVIQMHDERMGRMIQELSTTS